MKEYYISDGQNTIGPLSKLNLFNQNISKDTLVWYEGLSEWKKAGDIEELADLFSIKQVPPPLPKQTHRLHPFSESIDRRNYTMSETEPNQKKKSTKKIVLWCCGVFVILCVLGVIGYYVYEEEQYKYELQQCSNESLHPESYLSLDIEHADFNKLTGVVRNYSKHTTYEQLQMKLSYYDKDDKVLQSNVYTIKGTYPPQSSTPCKVKIKFPRGLKNLISTTDCDVEIIGATVKQN